MGPNEKIKRGQIKLTKALREIFCREGCSGDLATGLRAEFVLALFEAVAFAVHLQARAI